MKIQKDIEKGIEEINKDIKLKIDKGHRVRYDSRLVLLKALLQQNKEIIEVIDKQKWDENKDATTNQIATKMVEYSGDINSVIDRHNKSLEELKSFIIGSEERK